MTTTQRARYGLFLLTELDRPALQAHFRRLDEAARSMRFGASLSDETVSSIAQRLSLNRTTLGFYVWGQLRAVVSVIPYPRTQDRAELAISVEAGHQGRGWGRWLVQESLQKAADEGIAYVDVFYRTSNAAMAAILRGLPGVRDSSAGESHLQLDLTQWDVEHGRQGLLTV